MLAGLVQPARCGLLQAFVHFTLNSLDIEQMIGLLLFLSAFEHPEPVEALFGRHQRWILVFEQGFVLRALLVDWDHVALVEPHSASAASIPTSHFSLSQLF